MTDSPMKIGTLIFTILLFASFGKAVLAKSFGIPKAPDTRPMPTAPTADLPPIIDDVNRYKHDGTQPTLMQATPSQKAQIDWA